MQCRLTELSADFANGQSAFETKCQLPGGELYDIDDNNDVLPDFGPDGLNVLHNSMRYQLTLTDVMVNASPVITTSPSTEVTLVDLAKEDDLDADEEAYRRKLAIKQQGESTMAIIRIIGNGNKQPIKTASELANTFFGTNGDQSQYFAKRYELCSFGKKTFVPASDGSTTHFQNGVTEINIADNITGTNIHKLVNMAIMALQAKFGYHLFEVFDHVVFVVPDGSVYPKQGDEWMAFAFIGQYLSVFNDMNVRYMSHQLHEIGHNLGLYHSAHEDIDYGDQSCIMGYGYAEENQPQMCFNGAKSWLLGWYSDKAIEINQNDISRRSIYLSFFGDYEKVPALSAANVVLFKVGNYHMQYNLKKGINIQTMEFINAVTVTENIGPNELSRNKAALRSPGQKFTFDNGVTVEFCGTAVSNGADQVQLSLYRSGQASTCGSGFDNYLSNDRETAIPDPTNRPQTATPNRPPTPSPTRIVYDGSCSLCDDVPMEWMNDGCSGPGSASAIATKCNKNNSWKTNKWCQATCFYSGFGYDGDNCCLTATGTADPTREPTAEPTPSPVTRPPTPSPTVQTTPLPTPMPTTEPTRIPTVEPTAEPTLDPRDAGCEDDEMTIQIDIYTDTAPPNEIQWMLKERRMENSIAFQAGYASEGDYQHFYCVPSNTEYEFHLQSSPEENNGYFVISVDGEQYHEGYLKQTEVDYIQGRCGEDEARLEFMFETGKHPEKISWSLVESKTGETTYSGGPWGLFAGRSLSFFSTACLNVTECYTLTVNSDNYDENTGKYLGLSDNEGGGSYELIFGGDNVAVSSFPEGNNEINAFGNCIELMPPANIFGCFSGNSIVELQDGKQIRMEDTQIGDAVLTKGGTYETIYSFGHLNQKLLAKFVQLQTKSTTLELTSDHLIWVEDQQQYIPASLVEVGHILSNGEAILKIRTVQRRGVYAPFTRSGTIVVNDVVCSTYITMQPDSAYLQIGTVVTPIPWQWMDWVGEQFFMKLNQWDNSKPQQYTSDGVSLHGAAVLSMVRWVLSQHNLIQVMILAPLVLLFLTLSNNLALFCSCIVAAGVILRRRSAHCKI